MIEVIIVGVTMGLTVIASTLYRGSRRVTLLRVGCAALFIATLCRGIEPSPNGLTVDLIKRWAMLISQLSTVLIILTFRAKPASPHTLRTIYLGGGLIALTELALVPFLPVHADGTILHQTEVAEAAAQGSAWAFIAYHCVFLGAFTAAAAVVIIGCWNAVVQKGQPLCTRASLSCIFVGALGAFIFILSSFVDLFSPNLLGGSVVRTYILITVITIFFAGLATGVIRRVSVTMGETLTRHIARELVIPLWRTTTTLHPDVKLPPEDLQGFNQTMALSRLTIETHDALRLIREDNDPALRPVHNRHPIDPQLSAGLVRHLSGDNAVPPLGWFTLALTRLRTFRLKNDENLKSSVASLYEIRLAISEQVR